MFSIKRWSRVVDYPWWPVETQLGGCYWWMVESLMDMRAEKCAKLLASEMHHSEWVVHFISQNRTSALDFSNGYRLTEAMVPMGVWSPWLHFCLCFYSKEVSPIISVGSLISSMDLLPCIPKLFAGVCTGDILIRLIKCLPESTEGKKDFSWQQELLGAGDIVCQQTESWLEAWLGCNPQELIPSDFPVTQIAK